MIDRESGAYTTRVFSAAVVGITVVVDNCESGSGNYVSQPKPLRSALHIGAESEQGVLTLVYGVVIR